ncbi:hypothetical protein DFH28DRAFT_1082784 [Melampsora americana]|nr:hypothetical protein DFH28DRAFT_1082784 [Melampsora americana]
MSLSSRSGLRQKSSALLLNGLSTSHSASINTKSIILNQSYDPVSPNPNSTSNARISILEDDPCPWEDETNSLHLSSNPNPSISESSSTSPASTTGANTIDTLKILAQKRITTFVYLKKVHEGKVHWFNTILLTRAELEKNFDQQRMQRRTTRFAILGMSLSSLLDIMTFHDFLKGLLNLLLEYETIPDDILKPKMKGMFRQSKTPRKSSSAPDYPITLQESGESSYLFAPNIPFDLDYFEVWITLCDIIVEIYQKIVAFISNASPISPQTLNAPTFNTTGTSISTNRPMAASGGGGLASQSTLQGNLSQQSIDMINKVDGKFKKLVVVVTKEIDGIARAAIREELAQLDPMLAAMGSGPWDS